MTNLQNYKNIIFKITNIFIHAQGHKHTYKKITQGNINV